MDKPPPILREYLQKKDENLADTATYLWKKSAPIHERQNRPDSNENGIVHVMNVEKNIWRLLQTTTLQNRANNLEKFSPFEFFLLSCAACCHDYDKALKSASTLPDGFNHGNGSDDFVVKNAATLGLNRVQAKAIKDIISIHDLKDSEFQEKLKELKTNRGGPEGPYNQRRLAVLLKTADILHCDN